MFRIWEIALLALAILASSAICAIYAVRLDLDKAQEAFQQQVAAAEVEATHRLSSIEATMTALAALSRGSDAAVEMRRDVVARELLNAYDYIRFIGFAPIVWESDRTAFEQRLAAHNIREWDGRGAMRPATPRTVALPIDQIAPSEGENSAYLGFDILSDLRMAAAVQRSAATGDSVATDVIDLSDGLGFFALKAVQDDIFAEDIADAGIPPVRGAVALYLDGAELFGRMPLPFDWTSIAITGGNVDSAPPLYLSRSDRPRDLASRLPLFSQAVEMRALGRTFRIDFMSRPRLAEFRLWMIVLFALMPAAAGGAIVLALAHRRSARRQAARDQGRLADSERRFRDFADASADWFWEMGPDLRFTYFSPQLRQIIGVALAALIGKTRKELNVRGVDPEVWRQHLEDLDDHRPIRDFVYSIVTRDDRSVWLSVNGKPVFDDAGGFLGYRGVGRDVTAQIMRAQELAQAKQDAEAANRAKSEFLAGMSHELRTPLNAVIGFSQILKSDLAGPGHPPEHEEFARHIHEAGDHLLSLINDLLDLSKIESGKDELNDAVFEVEPLLEAALTMVRARADGKGVRLTLEAAPDLARIRADRRKMVQILVNLLSNAVKFTEGGGSVTLRSARAGDGGALFQVQDTGIGIAPEDIPKALERFRQIDNALNRTYAGTGLGLPLTEQLAKQHGGAIEIESELGVGTAITVYLPADRVVRDAGPGLSARVA